MKRVFDYYSDPSHGWTKVDRKTLEALRISRQISSCSYQRGDWVYLEEDCDGSLFHREYIRQTGKEPKYRPHHTDKRSRIRGYDLYVKPENPRKSGKSCLVEGTRVYVGDWVGFKCDIEQSGQILDIRRNTVGRTELVLGSGNDVFSGGYIGGQTRHYIDPEDCWVG